jgi:polyhydroxybutyrate depolymerase
MQRSRSWLWSVVPLVAVQACASGTDLPSTEVIGSGGTSPTAGAGSGGTGMVGTGGSGVGGAMSGAGGASNAGTGGGTTGGTGGSVGGSSGTGGSGTSGSGAAGATATGGTGGASNAGTGGQATGGTGGASAGMGSGGASAGAASGGASSGGMSAGGGSGGTREVKPSAGCARMSATVTIPNSLVGIPSGYTGGTPIPAVIAFHGAGNDNTSIQNAFRNSDLASKYLMVYPNSTSATTANKTGWNMQADKSRYLEVMAAILSQACVDENRVFGTGHSSGAQFIVQLLCSGDADFDAVAPVASSVYCQKWKNGPVPALILHGVQDVERTMYGLNDGNGMKDLQPYLSSNMCTMTSTPFDPDVSKCNNIQGIDGMPFNDGCVEFSGCAAPTRWCNHNDPNYGTSNHGIPCFGVRAIYDFFEGL